MFFPKRLIYRMIQTEEVIELGSALPKPTEVSALNIAQTTEGFESITGAKEMVVFIEPKDPKSILQHPVLGPLLQGQEAALFVERTVKGKKETKLRNNPTAVQIPGNGSIKIIHLVQGASIEGSPDDDTGFPLPMAWRNAAASLKPVVSDSTDTGDRALAIYVAGGIIQSPNAPHVLRALGRALGNVGYNEGLYKSDANEVAKDGVEPESGPAEDVVRSTRKAIDHVYLVTDVAIENETDITSPFKKGDLLSRVQTLCKFLAECPHNLLDCITFVKVLQKLNDAVRKLGANTEIEIYGPESAGAAGVTLTGSLDDLNLNVLKAVHQGSGDEIGPFMVRIKYRHPQAKGQKVRVVAGKSLTFDNGGNAPKGEHGAQMQGDMMGGASIAAEFARFGEEQPVANVDFIWGIAANKADGNARQFEDVMEHASGKTTEEANPDAEGRQVVADVTGAALRLVRKGNEEIDDVTTIATLTGNAIVQSGYRPLVMTKSKKIRRTLEDTAVALGERIQAIPLDPEDFEGVEGTTRADMRNVVPEGAAPRQRGAQTAGAYIADAAGIEELLHTHFDIAGGLGRHKWGNLKDVQGQFNAEGYLDTLHAHLTRQAA